MTVLSDLMRSRLVAIVRGVPVGAAFDTADALEAGGVRLLEVTLNTPGALHVIGRWRERFAGRLRVGAGTVLDAAMAREAAEAGAEFLISPNLDEAVIEFALSRGLEVWPGAMTPTEVHRAHRAGAGVVKVFPAGALGGPAYLKDLRGPLPQVPLMAVGGITAANARAHLEAGAVAVGAASALVDPALVAAGRFDELTSRARAFVEATGDRT